MAKAKSKLQKLQEEELTQINSIRNEASQIFFELGRIAIRRRNVNLQIDNDEEKLENQHDDLVKRESELYQTLNKKYGDGEIDPIKGEFIPSTEVKK
jgi:septal ring factor EnvC (AmiA/AmiB activator)|tara:strand:- start:200 stop:490 length:291 start_codon:yes stop_codon:yes gene_type:complete